MGAGEAGGCGKHEAAQRPAGAGAAGIADPGHGACRILQRHRRGGEIVGRRQIGVDQVEIGKFGCQPVGIGKAGKTVLGRDLGHGNGALGQFGGIGQHVRRHGGRPLADEGAQREIVALGTAGLLDLAEADIDRHGDAAHADGVGGVGAGPLGRRNEALGPLGEVGLVEHLGHRRSSLGLRGA